MKKQQEVQKAPKQRLTHILKNNLRLVLKVARITPDYFISVIVEGIIWGFINSAEALFTVMIFNTLDSGSSFRDAAVIIGLAAGFYLLAYAFDAWYWQYMNAVLRKKLELRLHRELFEKAQRIDIACYDDPAFYNDFVWAMDEAGSRAYEVMNDIGKIINRIVAAGTLFTLMFSIDIRVSVALLLVSLLSVVLNQIGNKIAFLQEEEMKPQKRVRDYLNRVFHLPDYAKEIRISHVTDLLLREMDKNTEESVKSEVKYGKRFFVIYGLCYTVLSNIVYYGVLFYMFLQLLNGLIPVGAFAAAVGMIWRVRWMLEDFVERLSKFPKHSLFLEKYYGFLRYESKTVSGTEAVDSFESIEFRDVSFAYDFSNQPRFAYHDPKKKLPYEESPRGDALKDISLSVKRGEKIALVGYNGAGKTTLLKLLMRLYDPTEGEILLNGKDIRRYDTDAYRARIGTVFQDFKIFSATIAENVMNGTFDEARDRETVLSALSASGFSEKLASLERGIDTVLTREFDENGTGLSGGEAQKVAIARVFARPYDLIIMDEPSSALDPIAEYELNQSILKETAEKTVIFISHRLSTTRMADRIYMFDAGRLAEVGTHEELMDLGGKYARMFTLQAEKYRAPSES